MDSSKGWVLSSLHVLKMLEPLQSLNGKLDIAGRIIKGRSFSTWFCRETVVEVLQWYSIVKCGAQFIIWEERLLALKGQANLCVMLGKLWNSFVNHGCYY
ncbi:hypothetical protein MKX03_014349 [Papaver bracteatum]|nr:hypothetical protein MKX03_014349 [Papaver bracteatum]